MKRNTFILIVIGLVVVCAVVVVALNLNTLLPPTASSTQAGVAGGPVKADVLEKFDALRAKVNASGMWFGGASIQDLGGDQTAMVYLYKQAGGDQADQLAAGFAALYAVFPTENPLLVGLVDTSQKLNSQQYKVDVFSQDRPMVEQFVDGDITKAELVKNATAVTPDNENSLAGNSTAAPPANPLPELARNYTPPADRKQYLTDYMNTTGYTPLSVQAGSASDGEKVVNLVMLMPNNSTNAAKYDEIETGFKACAGAYGDYDRYFVTLAPQSGTEYLVADAAATPVYDYVSDAISEYQLYNNLNLTYYTR